MKNEVKDITLIDENGKSYSLPELNRIREDGEKSMWIACRYSKYAGRYAMEYLIVWKNKIIHAIHFDDASYALELYQNVKGRCPACTSMLYETNGHFCPAN